MMRWVLFLILFGATPAHAAGSHRDLLLELTNQVIIPSYTRLERAASSQRNLWIEACDEPVAKTRVRLEQAFHDVSDAWAHVFLWTSGPIIQNLRRDRIYHWPERRNAVGKAVDNLLSSQNQEKLFQPVFERLSVAVQGLPALERLLFSSYDVLDNPYACALGRTIAINISKISKTVATEWRGSVLDHFKSGEAHPIHFGDPKTALDKLFTSILTAFIILKDQKLRPAMKYKIENANPKLLEAWRSDRSLHNLKLNIEIIADLLAVFNRRLKTGDLENLQTRIKAARQLTESLVPLNRAISNPIERKKLDQLISVLTLLQNEIASTYSKAFGLRVGFNSLDGD